MVVTSCAWTATAFNREIDMGLDVYGRLIMGVQVEMRDLFEEKDLWNHDECCKEDVGRGKKFCSNCGTKFRKIKKTIPTEGLRKLWVMEGFDEEHFDDDLSIEDLDDIVFNVNCHQGCEDDLSRATIAVGVCLKSTGFNRSGMAGPEPVTMKRFEDAKAKALEMAEALGIKDPKVNLYPTTYYSY